MESSQDQNLGMPMTQNSTNLASISESKEQEKDQISRLSNSSSSSSSCSSIEAEPKPNQTLNNAEQSPPTQVMERSTDNNNPTTSPKTPPYRIPSHVFKRTTSTAPAEWSTLSNESLFSIHMGNASFAGDYFKSDELTFPQPPSPLSPPPFPSPLPSPRLNTKEGERVVVGSREEVKTPVDIGKKAADADKAYRASKEEEQKAAASIREIIMANEAAKGKNKSFKLDRSTSRRSQDLSVNSFAFPILGNADKSESLSPVPKTKQRKPSQTETDTPKISMEAEVKQEEAPKPVTPKPEADRVFGQSPTWLSCFPCCADFCA